MPQAKLISPITRQEIRKVRVAAYCRVSSNSADQQNSYANQIRVYTSLIQRKKEWELVEIFAGRRALWHERTEPHRIPANDQDVRTAPNRPDRHQVRFPLRPKRQGVSGIGPEAETARRGGAVRERGNLHSAPRR